MNALTFLSLASLAVAVLWKKSTQASDSTETIFDSMPVGFDTLEIGTMKSSESLLNMLRSSEGGPFLVPTNRGDGGWTIGYGRFEKDRSKLPDRISVEEAEAMFRIDVADRGERWVNRYVRVPLAQEQFDALVSMAYNLSPRSFKTIADAVNAGMPPDEAALKFIRAGTSDERGLTRRRMRELALYHLGTYA